MHRRQLLTSCAALPALSALSTLATPVFAQSAGTGSSAAAGHTLEGSAFSALYEVNIRQHSPEGSLRAVTADLPRIRALGVGIVWLMPLQPIGELKRKGTLGSYYAIRDYSAVNPEFGTLDDLKDLVRQAHRLGLKVILDWVANHTAWDHPWVTQNPQWYRRNEAGEIQAVKANPNDPNDTEHWEDVAQLDYSQHELWVAMMEALRWWRREVGFDGFRCDVAGYLPPRFWELARQVLQQDGPLFMLAEADAPDMHRVGFDATYDWKLQQTLQKIAQGRLEEQTPQQLLMDWWIDRVKRYPVGSIGMNFITNHDINSWHGSDEELYRSPQAAQAMAVLTATLPGIPLLYSGQESFSRKRLAFFEKDPIDWGSRSQAEFYTRLLKWRSTHAALQAPLAFDGLEWVPDANVNVVTFKRRGPRGGSGARLQISVNLTNQPQKALGRINLPAWGWQIGAPTAPAKQNPPVRSRSGNAKPAAKSGAKRSSNSSSKSTPKKTSQSPQSASKAAPGR
jgi:1,4-alpha-glucan branching enzyme